MKLFKYILSFTFVFSTLSSRAQDYKLPPYIRLTLKNGLTVYLMEQHEVPLINVSV
ncbi:MAG: peptidase protein, partial [Chitinophagaceae bacterium]|nr:peptidase protein [Chitinophagaceae bacterium]